MADQLDKLRIFLVNHQHSQSSRFFIDELQCIAREIETRLFAVALSVVLQAD